MHGSAIAACLKFGACHPLCFLACTRLAIPTDFYLVRATLFVISLLTFLGWCRLHLHLCMLSWSVLQASPMSSSPFINQTLQGVYTFIIGCSIMTYSFRSLGWSQMWALSSATTCQLSTAVRWKVSAHSLIMTMLLCYSALQPNDFYGSMMDTQFSPYPHINLDN